ncbi:hypothetical protein DQ04_02741120 [Trypanosoma grayi]|uniref:hypothetical protein n=1 Tax=Trypanosoma grayi TaxID=71804 RepID=UPI0004F410C5|nr:hypothetical protein DQ04_02741120 [Trypanosoma grayi]KEG11327.1 hypothetical protein DQ04_02741120 [Trypanosoma grayi]
MDKARSFEYVYRLPATTIEEVNYGEAVYDRQVLLNETWASYALRKGRLDEIEVEHVKWITRTWDEEEQARSKQHHVLSNAAAGGERQIAARNEKLRQKQDNSTRVVAHIMDFQQQVLADKVPSRHNLHVDFDVLQQRKFLGEQNIVSAAEQMLRFFIGEGENGLCIGLCFIGECHRILFSMRLRDRLQKEEEERQRIAEEHRRAIEEERLRKEIQQKEEEEAERRRKEAMEEAKILERKRREEERRARARSERKRLTHHHNSIELIAYEESPPLPAKANDTPPTMEEVLPVVEPDTAVPQLDKGGVVYRRPEGTDIVALIKDGCAILGCAGDTSYVMSIDRAQMKTTVVCQNGCYLMETKNGTCCHLLGKTISEKNSISVASKKLHGGAVKSFADYCSSRVEFVTNSSTNDQCFMFDVSAEKRDETVVFFPILLSGYNHAPYVFAMSRDGDGSFQQHEVEDAAKVVWELGVMIDLCLEKKRRSQLCQQCVDWLTTVTGCKNCYISLIDEMPDSMSYVAASPSHQFMLGKKHTLAEEKNGCGISFNACTEAIRGNEVLVFCIDDISNTASIPFENQKVKTFLEGEKTGSLLVGTITGRKHDGGCTSLGVVFMDCVDTKNTFRDSEKEIFKTAVEILASLLLGNEQAFSLGKTLKIEDELQGLGPSSIVFLKCLWSQTLENLIRITPGQLLELAKYLHPPPIVPLVVQATLIVALGSRPQKVEKWEDAREKVTSGLLTKMTAFDPTDIKQRKKAFFLRAGKMLKGYGAKDVLERGSYPTSCFFSWTFAAILLRKHADKLRNRSTKDGALIGFTDEGSLSVAGGDGDDGEVDEMESGSEES